MSDDPTPPAVVDPDGDARTLTDPGPGSGVTPSSSGSLDGARFVAGALLAGRYRIVGLLGRGGMGEVYRAEDLKLGETVALKLLPPELTLDGGALARFHKEVKVARAITHPNVCRMYDIGEAGGLHFLSMEYVDGEDLSSLLHRIGRLPQDKAVGFARQLCAGLAAAHAQGVLHRDLKPGNVMIDGQGRARIMDFGLAGLAEDFQEGELAGTPAYMAPEQLERGRVSFSSDLYSLGLVLYETFTGRRPIDATSRREIMAIHRSGPPSQPSSIVEGLDPLVEQTIMRCLEVDPEQRPRSALEVSGGLPGGDPLAAALAAGETPSPEMVAAAPEKGALKPAVAVGCFAALIVLLAASVPLAERTQLRGLARLEKSPEVLADRAATLVERLGDPAVDRRHRRSGWSIRHHYLRHLRSAAAPLQGEEGVDRWDILGNDRPAALTFWHRQSPLPLHRDDGDWRPHPHRPPFEVPGMVRLELDPGGRLLGWWALPANGDDVSATEVAWEEFFGAAGLDPAAFQPGEPRWAPLLVSDARFAWEGAYPDQPDLRVRVEAASFRAQPVYFAVVEPWDEANGDRLVRSLGTYRTTAIFFVLPLGLLILFAGTWLAWRHFQSGRGDRRGATRLGLFVFACQLASWLLGAHHAWSLGEYIALTKALGSALFQAMFYWVAYLALEPFLRRYWPEGLISWTRLLAGSWRDPLVGRDVLVGCFFASVYAVTQGVFDLVSRWLGHPLFLTDDLWTTNLLGARFVASSLLFHHVLVPVYNGLGLPLVFVLAYVVLRRKWLAWAALAALLTAPIAGGPVFKVVIACLVAWMVVRFGVLTTTSFFVASFLLWQFPMTTDLGLWTTGRTIFAVALVAALGLYGLRTSLAGRPILEPPGTMASTGYRT